MSSHETSVGVRLPASTPPPRVPGPAVYPRSQAADGTYLAAPWTLDGQ